MKTKVTRFEKPLICDHADNLECFLSYLRTDYIRCIHRTPHEHVLGICKISSRCYVCNEVTECAEVENDNKKKS